MRIEKDLVLLKHMIDAANEVLCFTENKKREDLDTNRQLTYALIRCLEIIGEAASRLSDPFKERHTDIPWANIVGMRNRLIHAYFDINLDIVWKTVQQEIPDLKMKLIKLL